MAAFFMTQDDSRQRELFRFTWSSHTRSRRFINIDIVILASKQLLFSARAHRTIYVEKEIVKRNAMKYASQWMASDFDDYELDHASWHGQEMVARGQSENPAGERFFGG
jgi:hypothetical protein